jgi:hypothetical protein
VVSQLAAVSGVGAAAKPGIGPVSSFGSGSPPEGVVSLQQCWRWNWSWAGGRHSVQQLVAVGSSRSSCVLGSRALGLVPVAFAACLVVGALPAIGLVVASSSLLCVADHVCLRFRQGQWCMC